MRKTNIFFTIKLTISQKWHIPFLPHFLYHYMSIKKCYISFLHHTFIFNDTWAKKNTHMYDRYIETRSIIIIELELLFFVFLSFCFIFQMVSCLVSFFYYYHLFIVLHTQLIYIRCIYVLDNVICIVYNSLVCYFVYC